MGSFLTLVCQSVFSLFKGRWTDRPFPISSTEVKKCKALSGVMSARWLQRGMVEVRVSLATAYPNALTPELRGGGDSGKRLTISLSAESWGKRLSKAWKQGTARVFPSENRLNEEYFKWSVGRKQKHTRTKGLRQS